MAKFLPSVIGASIRGSRRMSVLLRLVRPHGTGLGVTGYGIKRGHPRNIITPPAVQKTQADKIAAQEPPDRPHEQINPAGALVRPGTPREVIGVDDDFGDLMIYGFRRVVEQICFQATHRAVDLQFFMHGRTLPESLTASP